MKTLILFFTLAISTLSFAQDLKGNTLTVTIDNVTNNNGKVVIGLHTSDTFLKGPGIKNGESTITDGKVTLTFKNVPSGNYAVLALHDQNENGRMDFDPSGMPLESFGSSNNPMSFGPPQFAESKFEVINEDIEMNIRF